MISCIVTIIAGFWIMLFLYGLLNKPFKWFSTQVTSCITAFFKACSLVRLIGFFALRGRLTVRASTYLMALLQPNATQEIANRLALSIDTYAAKKLLPGALYHLNEVFNGSSLALISEARLRGFRG